MGLNFRLYSLASTAVAGLTVYNAYQTRMQLYTTCVYLTTSKGSMMVLGNFLLMLFVLFAKGFKTVFLGKLRDVEIEHLTDKVWTTLMDTLLIMTIFRDEFNAQFLALFVSFLFVKIFHWLSQDRVDYLQQTPTVSFFTHVRIFSLMCVLIAIDSIFVWYAIEYTLQIKGPSILVFFGFEYLLLTAVILCTMIKYFLNIIDMRMEGRWENKGTYVLYLEFFTDMLKLVVYLVFFMIILAYYGVPLHIIRQLWFTYMSFRRRVTELIRYRKATANMNTRFPNATPEELTAAETCIVCREEMSEGKKLPCGHILHMHCLRSWLERQQVCPICRTSVLHEDLPAAAAPAAPAVPPPGPFVPPVNWAFPNPQAWQNMNMNMPPPDMNMNWMPPPPFAQPPGPENAQNNPPTNTDPNILPTDTDFALRQIAVMQQQIMMLSQNLQVLQDYILMTRAAQTNPVNVTPAQPETPAVIPDNNNNNTTPTNTTTAPTSTTTTTTTTTTSTDKEETEPVSPAPKEQIVDLKDSPSMNDPAREELRKRWTLRFSKNQEENNQQ